MLILPVITNFFESENIEFPLVAVDEGFSHVVGHLVSCGRAVGNCGQKRRKMMVVVMIVLKFIGREKRFSFVKCDTLMESQKFELRTKKKKVNKFQKYRK
jgi:hypothetical protein